MQKIIPCLWFDNQASEAISFYTSVFKEAALKNVARYTDAGPDENEEVMTGTFELAGTNFMALQAGPMFKFSPANSFFVSCETGGEIDQIWLKLADGGIVFMPLDKYPFSEKFGWIQDKFGLSWQLNLTKTPQKITPFLMFVQKQNGKAGEAINQYISIFKNSKILRTAKYEPNQGGTEGTLKHAAFILDGQEFMAMDSNGPHQFNFTEAVSYFVRCENQEEVDYFWEKLSEGGEKSRCGWLKDRYGVSWQIVPAILTRYLSDPDRVKAQRVMHDMLQMDKIVIADLEKAYKG